MQCDRRLHLLRHPPEGFIATDAMDELRLREGRRVHEVARRLFPRGVLVETLEADDAIRRTRELVEDQTVPVIFEGAFDSGDTVELFIEGKLNTRLSIPNNSGMSVRFEMQLVTISAATGRPNIVHNAIFLECFKKSNNVATGFYGAHANAAIHEVGGMGNNKIHMDIDVTTDTTQHRVEMHNQSFSNRETTRIVCKMSYVMGSL